MEAFLKKPLPSWGILAILLFMKLLFSIRVFGEAVVYQDQQLYLTWMQMEWVERRENHMLKDLLCVETQDKRLLKKPDYIMTRRGLLAKATQLVASRRKGSFSFEQIYKGES